MENEEATGKEELGVRLVILFVPVVLTARLLSTWLPKSLSWAGSMFVWMLAIYWFPSRANLGLGRWLIIVSLSAMAALVLANIVPDLF